MANAMAVECLLLGSGKSTYLWNRGALGICQSRDSLQRHRGHFNQHDVITGAAQQNRLNL